MESRRGRQAIVTVRAAMRTALKTWYGTAPARSPTCSSGGKIPQMCIAYASGMRHITTKIPNQNHWGKHLKIQNESAVLPPSAPAPTPAARHVSGSQSDAGGALAVVSGRAPGNGPHLVQRGNAQGIASRPKRRLHHAKRPLDSATLHQHTTPTTRRHAPVQGAVWTMILAAEGYPVVLLDYDQNHRRSHRRIAPYYSSSSRRTATRSERLRSGGRRSAKIPRPPAS